MPYPLPLTRTEAYLAYKAGVIQQSDLKPSLAVPRNGIDAWLAYWTGLAEDYPKREDGTPHILQEEEAYIAYLCGVINEYPEKCLRRVGAYLRYLISARWGRPDHPLNREELYLSLIKTQFIPSGDPSSDIVIDGTAKAPFVDVKMYGDTYQQSYEGKNILSIAFGVLDQGVKATHNPDGTLTLRGTCTAPYSNISRRQPFSLPAGTYTLSTTTTHPKFGVRLRLYEEESGGTYFAEADVPQNGSSKTFTLGSDAKSGYIWLSGTSAGLEIDETIGIQLEAGSTATSFEPYVGGVPSPNPEYPQQIQTVTGEQTVEVVGKNLFNAETETSVFIDSSGNIIPGSTWSCSDYIKVSPNTTYVWHGEQTGTLGGQVIWAGYDSSQAFISGQYAQTNNTTSTSFTTGNTTEYIRVGYRNDRLGSMQLELGSATSYEPYSKQTYTINLGKNLFDGTIYKTDYVLSPNGAETPYTGAVITSSIKVQPNTTYTVSANIQSTYDKYMRVGIYQGDMTFISRPSSPAQDGKLTFTTPANAQYVRLSYFVPATDVQLEVGSAASDFAPYFTPIELCKLGTYQDYIYKSGGKWYVRKETGKRTYTADDITIATSDAYSNVRYAQFSKGADNKQYGNYSYGDIINFFTHGKNMGAVPAGGWNSYTSDGLIYNSAMKDKYWCSFSKSTTLATMKEKLNGMVAYYALATPTDTEITNQALIDQLDALVNGGAEDGTTYIKVKATDPNLPGLLYVEAPKYD